MAVSPPPSADRIAYQMATKLSPPGALAKALGSTLRALWTGIADEFARVYARVADLLREVFASTTSELLTDWEVELGLPDPCVTAPQSEAERRAAVIARNTGVGGQSRTYFTDLAALMGIAISIIEEKPFEVGLNGMGDGIGGDEFSFTWTVTAPASTSTALRELMECTFERLKPAWSIVQFEYI